MASSLSAAATSLTETAESPVIQLRSPSHSSNYRFATNAIHAGQPPDATSGAVIIPISLSSTFQQTSPGVNLGYEYARTGNPTRNAFEKCVAACENGKHGLAFSSGLGATTSILLLFNSGDEVLCADDVYGGTNRLFSRILAPSTNMKFKFVDFNDEAAFDAAITENTKVISSFSNVVHYSSCYNKAT